MFLLDTNVISELRKTRPHGGVLAWMNSQPQDALFVPVIALFELQVGTELLRRQDPVHAQDFDIWISRIAAQSRLLSLDADGAREAARLIEKQSSYLMVDGMIAAIAKVNGLTVATRNVSDFERFGVSLFNPFDYQD